MMIDNAIMCLKALKNYTGMKLLFALSLVAWFYLFFKEKNRNIRIAFVFAPLIIMVLFVCPVTYWLYGRLGLDPETYYRIIWMIPIGFITVYAIVKFVAGKWWMRIAGALVAMALFALTGEFVYNSPSFFESENLYGLPQQTIDIVDYLRSINGSGKLSVLPSADLVTTIRQYDPEVMIPFGRDVYAMSAKGIVYDLPAYVEFELTERLNFKNLMANSGEYEIVYYVIHKARLLDDDPSEAGLEFVAEIDDHLIFRDPKMAAMYEAYRDYY